MSEEIVSKVEKHPGPFRVESNPLNLLHKGCKKLKNAT